MYNFLRVQVSTGVANFLSGGLASFAYWGMAIPADNIKKYHTGYLLTYSYLPKTYLCLASRMMSYPYPLPYPSSRSGAAPIKRPSFLQVTRRVYSLDGLAGFFRGLGPCLIRAFPANASALFVYEGLMTVMGAEKVHSR